MANFGQFWLVLDRIQLFWYSKSSISITLAKLRGQAFLQKSLKSSKLMLFSLLLTDMVSLNRTQNISLPWIEKYRPKNLNEVIDHQEKIIVLRRMIANRELPHLLFYGPPGCGKTSLILAAAREMFGDNFRQFILELNASDHRGIEIVRTVIPEFVKTKSDQLRLVILDESDALTIDSQNALRRVMEIYVKNSRFCLICNNITRIIPGIQSRCARIRFGPLRIDKVIEKVESIVVAEKVNIEPEAVKALVSISRDFRQVLNNLQCLHSIKQANSKASEASETSKEPKLDDVVSTITVSDIYDYVGQPNPTEVEDIYQLLLSGTGFQTSYQRLIEIFRENRWNFLDLIEYLCRRIIESSSAELTESRRGHILRGLSEIESRVVNGRDSELQLASLLALFTI